MQIIDSNIILAVVRGESQKEEGIKILLKSSKNIILKSILSEIYTVLLLRESYERAVQTIEWIKKDPMFLIVRETETEYKNTIKFLENNKTKLSFVDISLLIVSQNRNIPLRTFDQELRKYTTNNYLAT